MSHDPRTMRATVTGCVQFADLFQDSMLEEPPALSAPAEQRRHYAALERAAANVCAACPLLQPCLYRAVVSHDVAGFVAGTTRRQRVQLRSRLGVSVQPEDFDTLAGVARQHRQIDHDEVVRLRRANPHESLEQLAQRLGCSLSTVKRHLRAERSAPAARQPERASQPTLAQVMAAYDELHRGTSTATGTGTPPMAFTKAAA